MEMMIPKKRVSSGNWLHLRLELILPTTNFSVPNAAITSPQSWNGETRSSWWRVWCMALFCGQSVIAGGRFYRAIQQKTDNAACKRFLDLSMPWHWLRDTCSWISIPIMLTSMANQDASTLLNRPDQISPLHGMTNSPTLRAPGIWPPERSR
jgi:hypothetical protein